MRTKKCTKCGKSLSVKKFWKSTTSSDGLQNWCKSCRKHYRTRHKHLRTRRMAIKERWVIDYLKSHPCVDCGENDPIVLEFDHIRGRKIVQVSELRNRDYSLKKIMDEIAKCDVRCANCHRRKTHQQLQWHKHVDISALPTPIRASQVGENNACAKLNETKVKDILRRYANGEKQNSIAKIYSVSTSIIHLIVVRKKWKHVVYDGN